MHPLTAETTGTWAVLDRADHERYTLLTVDALSLAAAGTANEDAQRVLAALAAVAPGPVRVPWTDVRLAAPQAVLALSNLIHAWDFDDTHDSAVVHTSTVAVPAALVAAEVDQAAGERILDGIVTGVHVLSRLASMTGPRPGVIRTAGLGAAAAAAAAATTWGLAEEQVEAAVSLALGSCLSPTSRQAVVDGSVAKRVQPGTSASNGFVAAAMAREGAAGPKGWLSGPFGLVPGSELTWADVMAGPPEVSGIALKPYPACRYTHAAVAAGVALHARHPELADGDRIVAHLPAGDAYALVSRPFAPRGLPLVDAQFSLPWQLAALWEKGTYDLGVLIADLEDPAIPARAASMEVRQDLPESTVMSGAVVELVRDGSVVDSAEAEMPWSEHQPPQRADLSVKAQGCLRAAGAADPDQAVQRLFAAVDALPTCLAGEATTLVDASVPTIRTTV